MEATQILENNKLIAEFLNWECLDKYPKIISRYKTPFRIIQDLGEGHGVINNIILLSNSDKFYTDWNWLMQVVEKIESLGHDFQILNNICYIFDCDFKEVKGNTKIESVYNACLEFIKWYNENKQD